MSRGVCVVRVGGMPSELYIPDVVAGLNCKQMTTWTAKTIGPETTANQDTINQLDNVYSFMTKEEMEEAAPRLSIIVVTWISVSQDIPGL